MFDRIPRPLPVASGTGASAYTPSSHVLQMRHRPLPSLALILVVSGFTACGGGSSSGGAVGAGSCEGGSSKVLCLTACNLGCTNTGCELTEIAQNQPIVFTFSQDIDLRSVSTSSISLKTAQGEEPVGRYIVNGNTITFQPEVRTVGGATFFGFDPGAKYTLQLPGGSNNINSLVSTSGDRLAESFNCTISVSLGILDLDGLSPKALLIEPRVREDVDRDLLIRLEFTEIIDIGPFFGTNASTGPIRFLIRRLRPVIDPLTGMELLDPVTGEPIVECNPDAASTPLFGAPRVELDSVRGVTVVTYRAPQPLPGEKCVEIVVTDRVKDLSGNPARLQIFRLTTEFNKIEQVEVVEDFNDDTNLDRDLSAGTWANGEGSFAAIGGDGAHGEFSLRFATAVANEEIDGVKFTVFEMDTDNTLIPGTNTFDGRTTVIRDGVYRFSKFFLPPETKLRFIGTHIPQFHVRGLIDIRGIIDVGGEDVFVSDADGSVSGGGDMINVNEIGQPGVAGGPGAGDGGAGGDKPDGLGFQARFNGQDGGNGSVLAGHAYAAAAQNTGGKGSPMNPADGLNASVNFAGFQSSMISAGGGGGGNARSGENGKVLVTLTPSAPIDFGPDGEGGGGLPALLPVPPTSLSHEHFLIAGGGGGGGGGHPQRSFAVRAWNSGAAGAGGGGALLLRAGHRLALSPDSRLIASGGSGGVYRPSVGFAPPAPGGGGAGGAIVMQCANQVEVELAGFLDVRGGIGSTVEGAPHVRLAGGNGADGLIRLETPSPAPSLGKVQPAVGQDRTGELMEVDDVVAFQSRWIDSGELFPPDFLNYKLDVEIDGVPVTYSDDQMRVPNSRLAGPGEPVVFRIQGAILDLFTGEPDPLTVRPWRFYVGDQGEASGQLGLINDAPTGYRFLIILDRTVMGPGVDVKVMKLTVTFQSS